MKTALTFSVLNNRADTLISGAKNQAGAFVSVINGYRELLELDTTHAVDSQTLNDYCNRLGRMYLVAKNIKFTFKFKNLNGEEGKKPMTIGQYMIDRLEGLIPHSFIATKGGISFKDPEKHYKTAHELGLKYNLEFDAREKRKADKAAKELLEQQVIDDIKDKAITLENQLDLIKTSELSDIEIRAQEISFDSIQALDLQYKNSLELINFQRLEEIKNLRLTLEGKLKEEREKHAKILSDLRHEIDTTNKAMSVRLQENAILRGKLELALKPKTPKAKTTKVA